MSFFFFPYFLYFSDANMVLGMVLPPTVVTVSVLNGSWLGCVPDTPFGIAACILVSLAVARRRFNLSYLISFLYAWKCLRYV